MDGTEGKEDENMNWGKGHATAPFIQIFQLVQYFDED